MKKSIYFLVFLLIASSCSKEETIDAKVLIGIWERTSLTENSTSVDKLVFKSDNSGIKTHTENHKSGEVVSSASDFKWNLNDGMVTLTSGDNSTLGTYVINIENEISLVAINESPYIKVSNTVLDY
ncbi:hypothetical protein ACFO5O_03015 [Geojedonia litorea]|uniref:Lipocalin-like domain-containing protein n=1 Tax=Geojedonia litorea TaxID=1268269 RepID=A0ABV9N1Y2_9FLAO